MVMAENDNLITLENESGQFVMDRNGQLIKFSSRPVEGLHYVDRAPLKVERVFYSLHIPEGVRSIGEPISPSGRRLETFSHALILDEVTFPKSLSYLGDGSFSNCVIHKTTLPPTLKQIGLATFMCSLIHTLEVEKERTEISYKKLDDKVLDKIDEKLLIFGGRSFKESTIVEVRIVGNGCKAMEPCKRQEYAITAEEWVHMLMPEAGVSKIVKARTDKGQNRCSSSVMNKTISLVKTRHLR